MTRINQLYSDSSVAIGSYDKKLGTWPVHAFIGKEFVGVVAQFYHEKTAKAFVEDFKDGYHVDAMNPKLSVLVKLGSLLMHYQEFLSPQAHHTDRLAIQTLEKDHEVIEWVKAMQDLSLLPVKR